MNIFIIGHSICKSRFVGEPKTFPELIFQRYNVDKDWLYWFPACSEERILYYLRKKKKIDIAIIFHSNPSFMFTPIFHGDLVYNMKPDDDFWKVFHRIVFPTNATTGADLSQEELAFSRKSIQPNHSILDIEKFKEIFFNNNQHFQTPELNRDRHNGALIQIDQYLKAKNIPTIHCVLPSTMPSWFKFSHGIVDYELGNLDNNTKFNIVNRRNTELNDIGHQYVADKLCMYIEQLLGRSGES